ncbi:hypothetical protein KCU88_g71, partial [Aureobasidium melanogenum]
MNLLCSYEARKDDMSGQVLVRGRRRHEGNDDALEGEMAPKEVMQGKSRSTSKKGVVAYLRHGRRRASGARSKGRLHIACSRLVEWVRDARSTSDVDVYTGARMGVILWRCTAQLEQRYAQSARRKSEVPSRCRKTTVTCSVSGARWLRC